MHPECVIDYSMSDAAGVLCLNMRDSGGVEQFRCTEVTDKARPLLCRGVAGSGEPLAWVRESPGSFVQQALLVDTIQPYPVVEDRATRDVASTTTLLDAVCGHDVPLLRTIVPTVSQVGRHRSARPGSLSSRSHAREAQPGRYAAPRRAPGRDLVEKHRGQVVDLVAIHRETRWLVSQSGYSIAVAGNTWDRSTTNYYNARRS